jgi:hypothetical protein
MVGQVALGTMNFDKLTDEATSISIMDEALEVRATCGRFA